MQICKSFANIFDYILKKPICQMNRFSYIYSKTALKLNSKGYDYFTQTLNLYNFSSLILNRFEYIINFRLYQLKNYCPVVIITFPLALFDSKNLCAKEISSNVKIFAILGFMRCFSIKSNISFIVSFLTIVLLNEVR